MKTILSIFTLLLCASIAAQFGYTKQSYQLLQYNSDLYYLDYPEIIRQRNHK
ncbi:MAG: hypothetical protein IKP89_00460 [Bacteroidales bacterium]|nr:hypothetical protein [Bacteroidales bacterium]